MSLRTTRLRDVEGVVWHVPNGDDPARRQQVQQWSRAVLDVPVAFDADAGRGHRRDPQPSPTRSGTTPSSRRSILAEPEVLGVESLAPGPRRDPVVVQTEPHEQWRVARELRARIKAALDDAGIALAVGRP